MEEPLAWTAPAGPGRLGVQGRTSVGITQSGRTTGIEHSKCLIYPGFSLVP